MFGATRVQGGQLIDRLSPWWLVAVAIAEVVTRAADPRVGALMYAAVVVASLNAAAAVTDAPNRRLILAIATVGTARIVALAAPFVDVAPAPRLLGAAVIVAVAVALTSARAGALGQPPRSDGSSSWFSRWWLLAVAVPLGFGTGFTIQQLAAPTLLLGFDPGGPAVALFAAVAVAALVEELLFRGFLQGAAVDRLGPARGITAVTALSALLATPTGTPWGIELAAALALLFGIVTWRIGSILPAAIGHAALNVGIVFFAVTTS